MAQKHLRRPAVQELTGLSRSTIYDLMNKGLRGGCGNLNSRDKWIFRVTAA